MWSSADDDCDGTADRDCIAYTYDGAGFEILVAVDEDCDGVGDVCTATEFDGAHSEYSSARDWGCDGTRDEECVEGKLDETGQPTYESNDRACDGVSDSCVSSFYDASGRNARMEFDVGCDGVVEQCSVETFERDASLADSQESAGET